MNYTLTESQLTSVKNAIKDIDNKISMWQIEIDKAQEDRKRRAAKYYKNINVRINYAKTQIEHYTEKKKELEQILEQKCLKI